MSQCRHWVAADWHRIERWAWRIMRGKHWRGRFAGVVLAAVGSSATAAQCPEPINKAVRLVLVTTPTMDGLSADMRLFVRDAPGAAWVPRGSAEPAVVGQAGLAWG